MRYFAAFSYPLSFIPPSPSPRQYSFTIYLKDPSRLPFLPADARRPADSAGPVSSLEEDDNNDDWRFGDHTASSYSYSKHRTWWAEEPEYEDDYRDLFESNSIAIPFGKVMKTIGWILPAICVSLVMGTGSNAFFMALAVPLGQFAISMLFDKIWETGEKKASRKGKPKSKVRKRPGAGKHTNAKEPDAMKENDRGQMGYSYGGWDDLGGEKQNTSDGKAKEAFDGKFDDDDAIHKSSKLSTLRRVKEKPLFVRLLLSVFPFLGSWSRVF